MVEHRKIVKAIQLLLEGAGEDLKREGVKETPERVARMYEEILGGINKDPAKVLKIFYEKEEYNEIVLLKDIPIYSMCEHHLLPFFGKVHVAYLPKRGRLTGLSKIARVVEIISHRLQMQERLTHQIAQTLWEGLRPLGVMVVCEAEHFCLTMRGIKKPGTKIITSALRGVFLKDARSRQEVLALLNSGRH